MLLWLAKSAFCLLGSAIESALFWVVVVWLFKQDVPAWAYFITASIGWESVRSYLYTNPLA